jgi:hypothetical protein
VTPDEDADWSLIDLAKQVFGARNASDVGFDFAETKPAAEDAPPTPLAAEVAVVEQREPATAKTSEEPSPASETAPPRAIAEAKEAELRRRWKPQTRMGGNSEAPPKWPALSSMRFALSKAFRSAV